MAIEEGTATLICPTCSAEHKATWYRLPVCDQATAHCKVCGTNMGGRRSNREYENVELILKA